LWPTEQLTSYTYRRAIYAIKLSEWNNGVAEKGVEFLRGAAYLPAAFLAANAYARHCRWPKPPTTHYFHPPRFPFVLGSLALVLADWGLKNHSLRKCVCVKVASWQSESRRDFSRGRCVPFVIAIIVFAARCFHTPNICSG